MINIDRTAIHALNRHSNWPEARVGELLKAKVYNDFHSWKMFLRLFFITLGVGFTTSGIIFFFAYNWVDLNKFVKIGLIEGLIVVTTLVVLFSKLNPVVKHILLTGYVVLTGGLIAVFGQIYHTGANAYDFFLLWTVLVTLWVVVSDFAPLWLIWITLIESYHNRLVVINFGFGRDVSGGQPFYYRECDLCNQQHDENPKKMGQ